jgi:hypothetical protein
LRHLTAEQIEMIADQADHDGISGRYDGGGHGDGDWDPTATRDGTMPLPPRPARGHNTVTKDGVYSHMQKQGLDRR